MATRWKNQGGKFADVRIALGGMDEIPRRSKICESILEGGAFSEQTMNEAILALKNDFNPIGDVRANADYRKKVAIAVAAGDGPDLVQLYYGWLNDY